MSDAVADKLRGIAARIEETFPCPHGYPTEIREEADRAAKLEAKAATGERLREAVLGTVFYTGVRDWQRWAKIVRRELPQLHRLRERCTNIAAALDKEQEADPDG